MRRWVVFLLMISELAFAAKVVKPLTPEHRNQLLFEYTGLTFESLVTQMRSHAITRAWDEPSYTKLFMNSLTRKLLEFYTKKKIHTPKEKLAFLMTATVVGDPRSYGSKTWLKDAVEKALKSAASFDWRDQHRSLFADENTHWRVANNKIYEWLKEDFKTVLKKVKVAGSYIPGENSDYYEPAFKTAFKVGKAALNDRMWFQDVRHLVFRAAELHLFLTLLQLADDKLEESYTIALQHLPEFHEKNPFQSFSEWDLFQRLVKSGLYQNKIYVQPWFDVLNPYTLSVFGYGNPKNLVNGNEMPIEVYNYILRLAAQTYQ